MKIPKRFKKKVPCSKDKKYYHYEFVKEYPNFYQYRCLENGALECFQKSYFIVKKGVFEDDHYHNKKKSV